MLCRTMRYFSCSYCVTIMLLKAFDYTMMVDVVLHDEMFFMLLLRVNYAFESLWLCDDNGYCVSSWRRGVRSTRYELCFWKPVVGEERAYLGYVITCCFQTRYGFCFFQLRGECEKTEPVPGSFYTPIYSPRRLISFANVGLSKAQLVPSCDVIQRVCDAI